MSCPLLDGSDGGLAQISQAGSSQFLLFDGDDLRIRLANREAQRALGYSSEELKSLTFLELTPEISKQTWQRLARRMEGGGGF